MSNINDRKPDTPRSTRTLLGVYEGTVVDTRDATLNGRLTVHIPALKNMPIPTGTSDGTVTCAWSSPFAGTANSGKAGGDPKNSANARTSYGLWMVPPDVGNRVLVAFVNGQSDQGYVIGCLFDYGANHMVPGAAAGKTHAESTALLSAAEKDLLDPSKSPTRPVSTQELNSFAVASGVAAADNRGVGTSGARRESPSEVFGILTPGPKDPDDSEKKRRLGGHQFIMDDNLDSRLIRLRTANNMQVLLDDTEGMIFINNQDGTGWVEINKQGKISVYSKSDIAMRAQGDFHIRADHDIIMEAGNDVKIKAAGDTMSGVYMGTDISGQRGHVQIECASNFTQSAGYNINMTSLIGDTAIFAGGALGVAGVEGVAIKAEFGDINTESLFNTTMRSELGGMTFQSGTFPLSLQGTAILLNTPGGVPALPASVPTVVRPMPAPKVTEMPGAAPPYDPAAAAAGEPALPTAAQRADPVSRRSIVPGGSPGPQPDPGGRPYDAKSDGDPVKPEEAATEKLPSGTSNPLGDVDDVATPGGTFLGAGLADENGNPVDSRLGRTIKTIAGKATEIASTAKSTVSDVINITKTFSGGTDTGTTGGGSDSSAGATDTATGTAGDQGLDLTGVADKFAGASQKVQTIAQDICNLPGQIAGMVTGMVREELNKIAGKITAEISEKISGAVAKLNKIIGMKGGNHLVVPANVGALITIIQTIIELSQLEFPCSLKDMKNSLTQGLVSGITGAVTGVVGDTLNQITGELNNAVTSVLGTAKNALVGSLVDAIPGDNILTDLVESGIALVGDNVAYAVDRGINRRIIDSGNKLVDLTFRSIPTYAEITGVDNNFRYPTDKRLFDQPKDLIPLEALAAAMAPITQPGQNRARETIIGSGYVLSEEELKYRFAAVDPLGAAIPVTDPQVEDMRLQIADALANSATQNELEAMLGYYGITVRTDLIYQGNGEKSYIFQNKEGLIFVDFTRGLGNVGATIMLSAKLVQVWDAIKTHIRVKLNDNQSMAIASFALSIGPEVFLQSDVLDTLNRGEYNQISRLMQGWVAVKRPYNTNNTIVPQLKARRHFEGQLFQTPDEVVIGSNPNKLPGQTTFDQLAYKIKNARRDLLIDKAARNGYEIKPFPCCDCD